MSFDYSQTYLYKLHKLTNSLDKVFDQHLRVYAGLGFSQFTLLLSVDQHQPATQRVIANFLDISPAAISRQVDIARQNGWITSSNVGKDKRAQTIVLTAKGKAAIEKGMDALQEHVFQIFSHDNTSTNLMSHIDMLQTNIDELSGALRPALKTDHATLPKASDLFTSNGGDINRAVIDVQKAIGHYVSEKWWAKHIGKASNDIATAERFDVAYARYIQQIAELDK